MAHTFRVQQSLSAGELSLEVLIDLGPLLESVEVPQHAMVLNTVCGEDGAAAVRQMWHYNDLDVLSGHGYLGPECEPKLAFALLHGTDPQLVTLNALHRGGVTTYRQLFAILSERRPLPEQRWINAVMQQSGPAPGPSFVPFEAGVTPQSLANQFDWSTLVHRIAAQKSGASSDVNFGADSEDSGLTEVPVGPDLGCDDRPLTYSHIDDDPDADGNERHRSLCFNSRASRVVQSYVMVLG